MKFYLSGSHHARECYTCAIELSFIYRVIISDVHTFIVVFSTFVDCRYYRQIVFQDFQTQFQVSRELPSPFSFHFWKKNQSKKFLKRFQHSQFPLERELYFGIFCLFVIFRLPSGHFSTLIFWFCWLVITARLSTCCSTISMAAIRKQVAHDDATRYLYIRGRYSPFQILWGLPLLGQNKSLNWWYAN